MGRQRTQRQRAAAATVAMAVVCVVLALAPAALAGWVTGIQYGLENWVTYSYTPATTGTLDIEISWVDEDGNASVYPRSEVDVVVQGYDPVTGESYQPFDLWIPWWGNPGNAGVTVTSQLVGRPLYVAVAPWLADCQYRIRVWFKGALVIDQTGTAYGHGGELFLPSTTSGGAWHSVMQYWPGTLNRSTGTSDVYANWDDYAWEVDASGPGILANAWQVDLNSYVPPLVTNAPIDNKTAGYSNRWYIVAPEIWTGAARPNVWTKIATDLYPKPGTLAYNAAPLWYTWAYSDSAAPDAVAYFGGVVANTGASGHSFTSLVNTNSSVSYTFTGTSFKWIYTKGPSAGVAKVVIDGGTPILVDQYSATAQLKQSTTFSGLASGAHTVVISSNKTKNPASTNYVVYHDAFEATQFAGDQNPLSQNNSDGSTRYAWGKVNNVNAHGGSFSQEHNTNAALAFTFTGTSIDYIYTKGPNGGIARVYIDGVNKGTVDLYAASATFQQSTTFSGLPAGTHTILIVNNKTKNPASGNYVLYFDAFKVGSTYYEN